MSHIRPYLLIIPLLVLWTVPSSAYDPHPGWTKAVQHLRVAKTGKDPLYNLVQAQAAMRGMSQRSGRELDQFKRAYSDVEDAIREAKKGASITREDTARMQVNIQSALTHLQGTK